MLLSYKLMLRFITIGILVSFFAYQWGYHLIQLLIPAYKWVIKLIDYRFDQIVLTITQQHQQKFLSLETVISQPFMVNNQLISPDIAIPSGASMPLGNVLIPIVIIFTLILAWPVQTNKQAYRHYLIRLLIALPLCLLIMLLDMPLQLLKMVWESLNQLLQLSMSSQLPYLAYWSDFLNGGGLMALSIAAGMVVIGVCNQVYRPR